MNFLSSGFICGPKGHVLTCAHAIDMEKPLFIIPPTHINTFTPIQNRKFHPIPAELVQWDPINDVALIKIKGMADIQAPPPSIMLQPEHDLKVGTSVAYFGYPFVQRGLQLMKVSNTIVSAKSLNHNQTRQIVLDSTVNDGNSGGPLFNVETGRIIGIISGRYSPSGTEALGWVSGMPLGQDSNISFATGISYAITLLNEEKSYE